jgi:hypothetical protein
MPEGSAVSIGLPSLRRSDLGMCLGFVVAHNGIKCGRSLCSFGSYNHTHQP